MTGRTVRRRILRISLPGPAAPRADLLATEEPLGIRVNGQAVTLTMRTPGDDIDLAVGFLAGEGVVRRAGDITAVRICAGDRCGHAGHDGVGNVADVTLRPGAGIALRRNFLTTSACGVCGKTSIAELSVLPDFDVSADPVTVSAGLLAQLPDRLRAAQRVFDSTGGLHAAGLFRAGGELLVAREDVGRHNAVDKVTGWALRAGLRPLPGCVLLVSGRASFELVQKAVLAGIPVLAAVSAPSSLAADLAERAGLTLVGFLRGGSMNVYTGTHRVTPGAAPGQASPDPAPRAGAPRA